MTKWIQRTAILSVAALAAVSAACGDMVREGRAPVQIVVNSLEAASGARPNDMGATLLSDVVTLVDRTVGDQTIQVPTTFNDVGQVTLSLLLKDPGTPGNPSAPSAINSVTINRYRVSYRRTDGRNTPGVDVPFAFDSAVSFTIPATGTATAGFEIVRHTAKEESPLAALRANLDVIATITEVTFYGRDQAGNDVSVSGTLGINFGNFADPAS